MTQAKQLLNLSAKGVPAELKDAFEGRAARIICKTHDPFNVHKAWDNRDNPDYRAQWETIVTLTKMQMQGHFDAGVIAGATLTLGD